MVDDVPARYRTIDDLGLTVPATGILPIRGGEAEIVKTYADCAVTAVFFRKPPRTIGFPHILEPFGGGAGGRQVGDQSVLECDPVEPARTHIIIGSDAMPPWSDEGPRLSLPVDRARTAPFDRFLSGVAPEIEQDGIRSRVSAVNAGLLRTTADVHAEAIDPTILALELTNHFRPLRHLGGPGPAELWAEWHPPSSSFEQKVIKKDGRTVVSVGSTITATARRLTPEELKERPLPRNRPPEWVATAQPGARPLAMHGAQGGGRPPGNRASFDMTLHFDPPGDAGSIDLSLDRLWAARYDYATVTVPSPDRTSDVKLDGIVIEGRTCRIALTHWEPSERGFALHATCDPPDVWPDVRIVAEGVSTSLWTSPPEDGIFRGGLPLSHAQLFTGPSVLLALRMVLRTVPPIRFHLPLTQSVARGLV